MPPHTEAALIELLSTYLQQQTVKDETLIREVSDLSKRIDKMDRHISSQISNSAQQQTRILGGLLALVIVLMGAMAGLTVSSNITYEGIDIEARQTAENSP